MKSILIQASSRSNGHTHQIVQLFREHWPSDFLDLKPLRIHPYTYEHAHQDDDFMPTMRQLLEYDLLIFATPVYWYSMSGILKNFLDRISDCLKIEKETGRQLRGKKMIAICCGTDHVEIEGYFVPFRLTAEYLGMGYWGDLHTWVEDKTPSQEIKNRIEAFAMSLKTKYQMPE